MLFIPRLCIECLCLCIVYAGFTPEVRPTCYTDAIDTSSVRKNSTIRLRELRKLMLNSNAQAYLIFNKPGHEGRIFTDHNRRWCYMTDVCETGGMVVITRDKALIWTTGTKYAEAEQIMDCQWTLMLATDPRVPSMTAWLIQELDHGNSVHLDSRFITIDDFKKYEAQLATDGLVLIGKSDGLVDQVWDNDAVNPRPEQAKNPVVTHDIQYAGKAWEDKLDDLRKKLKENSADAIALTGLDDIAWLFNIRGSDIRYSPLALVFVIVTANETKLYLRDYINQLKSASLRTHLNTKTDGSCTGQSGVCVEVKDYNTHFYSDVAALSDDDRYKKIWVSQIGNYELLSLIKEEAKALIKYSPVAFMREVKNSVEREGMKKAFIKHGVGVIQHFAHLEKEVKAGKKWTEMDSAVALENNLKSQKNYHGFSFKPIVASGPNAALPHYVPNNDTNRDITTSDLYVQDTGSQFLEGTTDGTRTLHFGAPSDFEKEVYTRVLMGHIDLAKLVWPSYIEGYQLDLFARTALWNAGLEFQHGVGHGVGQYLYIHEGPACIWQKCSPVPAYMKDGIFISIEPGYYEASKFGVRLESIYMVERQHFTNPFKNLTYLGFTPVTMVPFEPHLIKKELLTYMHLDWLNNYHAKVAKIMGDELRAQGLTDGLEWVNMRTKRLVSGRGSTGIVRGSFAMVVAVMVLSLSC